MSQDLSSSPSLLSELKRFSLEKNLPKLSSSRSGSETYSSSGSEIIMSKKGVPIVSDSEDDDASREKDLLFLAEAFPTKDKMVLQDALMEADWQVETAMMILCEQDGQVDEQEPEVKITESTSAKKENFTSPVKKETSPPPMQLVIEIEDSDEDCEIQEVKEIIPTVYRQKSEQTNSDTSVKTEVTNNKAERMTSLKTFKKGSVKKTVGPTVKQVKKKPSLDSYLKKEGVVVPKAIGGVDLESVLRTDLIVRESELLIKSDESSKVELVKKEKVKSEYNDENDDNNEVDYKTDIKRENYRNQEVLDHNDSSMDSSTSKRKFTPGKRTRSKKLRRDIGDDVEEDEEGGNNEEDDIMYRDTRVYVDSDDSDTEVSSVMTEDKQAVLDFLRNAEIKELLAMCTKKRAEILIELRPFNSWVDLVEKLRQSRHMSTDILNQAQDILVARREVRALMKKCRKLAVKMERRVAEGESSVTVQPNNLNASLELAGYQMIGLNWMLILHNQEVNGILADEMGLGKTVQVIALLAHLYKNNYTGPHLIVVPSSTLENWSIELHRWCPDLRTVLYYGSPEERKWMRVCWFRDGMDDVDVILTTYSIINNTPEERKMFRILPLKYVIFDEAHMLKNMETQRYENLIKINAEHRILLTGTPLQNSLLELMSLLIFVMPRMFSGKEEYIRTLFSKLPRKNTGPDEDLNEFEQEQVSQARRIMKPFILRRLKRDVLKDLTEKTEETEFVPMSSIQEFRYNELIEKFTRNTQEEVYETSGFSGATMVTDLRKAANHTALLRYYYTDLEVLAQNLAADPTYKENNQQYIQEDLAILSDFAIHQLTLMYKSISEYSLPESVILDSGKFRRLDQMLPKLKSEGHRVLIFSQFVIMLDILQAYLLIRDHSYLRLDGSTLVTSRQELIDRFNEDNSIFVFLLSTRAGGLGINLTAADTVIIHDIDFNPYNDKQAEDRCHRVGQSKKVTVTRFISKNTIEEGIHRVALEKLKLEQDINNPDGMAENEQVEHRNVVRLLKEALGYESQALCSDT